MYLLDTNILLELLLDQTRADEVERFLHDTSPGSLFVSEFALYSLGIIMFRRQAFDAFLHAVDDLLVNGGVRLLRLGAPDMREVAASARQYRLDFDDAYQYVLALKHDLVLLSFDSDFDRTERGRRTPEQILAG